MTSHDQHDLDSSISSRARDSFESAVDSLDAGTRNRLRLMRREALSSVQSATRRPWLVPVVAVAAAVLAVGLAWRTPQTTPVPSAVTNPGEDVAALEFPSDDEAELYAWLGEGPVATTNGESL